MSGSCPVPTVGTFLGDEDSSLEHVLLSEVEVVQLIIEYLSRRNLTSTQLELEKETAISNEYIISPDVQFLRSLVLDGRWDDVLEFLQPLEEAFRNFPGKKVKATIYKYSFLDKLLFAHHSIASSSEAKKTKALEELVKILEELEHVCESKEEYSSLCLLLTSPNRLAEHTQYKDWKSATARLMGFTSLKNLVQKYIPPSTSPSKSNMNPRLSQNDRLIQLLIKGVLYEASVDYCQLKSRNTVESKSHHRPLNRQSSNTEAFRFPPTLLPEYSQLSEADLSLVSWLRSIPQGTFNVSFPKRNLRIDIQPLPPVPPRNLMNVSILDSASDLLTRSMASTSFHLSTDGSTTLQQLTTMNSSVDRLFGEMAIDSFHQTLSVEKSLKSKPPSPPPKPKQVSSTTNNVGSASSNESNAKFLAVTLLEDVQAVRCAEFHPSGQLFSIGSNSKTLRLCAYPDLSKLNGKTHKTYQPTILYKRTKHHKGSIYCMGWSPCGEFLATGSNDKTVKLLRFNDILSNTEPNFETELTMHDGTIRDICFIQENSHQSSLLASGGAGDCKIYVTDLSTTTPFQALSGHTGPILSLYNWGGGIFCSGSQDKTIRFWDLRTRGCVDVITPLTSSTSTKSPVASVCVESSGRLMISGHEDSAIVLYDIRGQRQIQSIKTHSADVRSIRFSPASYYLLSAGYDNRLILTDLQGDLSNHLPNVVVATHQDKVISGRWHPLEFTFLSTSADKTSILWALPPEI